MTLGTNLLLIALFAVSQHWIARTLTARIRARFAQPWRSAATAAVWGVSVAAVACCLCTLSDFMHRLGVNNQAAMLAGAVGLACASASITTAAVCAIMRVAHRKLDAETNPARRRALKVAGNAVMACPFAVLGYGSLIQRTNFQVKEVDAPFADLPDDLNGLRILQLSDIHLSPFLSVAEFSRVIDAAIELKPHLAVVTGDLISGGGDPLDDCVAQLARLRADAGLFGCMGNHERYAKAESYLKARAARKGLRFLRGEARQLKFGNSILNIAGVDYQSLSGRQFYLKGAERLTAPGAFNLLLSHNPDVLPVAARQGWNLMLGGHTHGGQVTVEILDQSINPARFLTPYVQGLYRESGTLGYVTRGVGTIGIPARIGAPPEITVIRLRKA